MNLIIFSSVVLVIISIISYIIIKDLFKSMVIGGAISLLVMSIMLIMSIFSIALYEYTTEEILLEEYNLCEIEDGIYVNNIENKDDRNMYVIKTDVCECCVYGNIEFDNTIDKPVLKSYERRFKNKFLSFINDRECLYFGNKIIINDKSQIEDIKLLK